MNKNKFSFQFLSSDRLHQINFSLSNFLIFLGMFTAAFVALNYSLSLRFSDDYYKVKLKETDEKYSEVSQELMNLRVPNGSVRGHRTRERAFMCYC